MSQNADFQAYMAGGVATFTLDELIAAIPSVVN
jgi:hypothetical protein